MQIRYNVLRNTVKTRRLKMSTSMVTARMDEFKKARGNAVLKKHGKTASGVINEMYD